MGSMRIQTMVLGAVQTDCYLVYGEDSKEGVIIDPADNADYIGRRCMELHVTPRAILLTHGHGDHILAVEELRRQYGIPVIAGEKEADMLLDPVLNLSQGLGMAPVSLRADQEVQDGDVLALAGFSFRVIETPGHTSGSLCYYVEEEKVLFSGDTLFAESLGRTDFPTGNTQEIIQSIAGVLLKLPEDVMVYPGHGEPTTIGHERKYNPVARFVR